MNARLRSLLILDLDETLIYSTGRPLDGRHHDFILGPYYVYHRPYLETFLITCSTLYDLAFWSSGGCDYVRGIVARIMPTGVEPVFMWSRERCTVRTDLETQEGYFLKDLKKVKRKGFDLNRVLIVEDTPRNVQRNYGNAIYVSSYRGEADDNELVLLERYLVSLSDAQNVRCLEKRGWRRTVEKDDLE